MRKITEDFIGTCQACFGEFKVSETSHEIVLHGYKRPGNGYIHSECGGTAHAPFEYDTKLTVRIIAGHRAAAAAAAQRFAKLNEGLILRLTHTFEIYNPETRRYDPASETVEPGHERWEQTLRIEKVQVANTEDWHTKYADYLQKMVDAWTRGTIVGIDVPTTGKPKTPRGAYDPVEAAAMEERAKIAAARDAKPGKLKVLFYVQSQVDRAKCDTDADWRARYERIESEKKTFVDSAKLWAKTNITGKSMVREASDYDLPNAIRRAERDNNLVLVAVHFPWEYLDQITTLFSTAVPYDNEKKKKSFVVAGPVKTS